MTELTTADVIGWVAAVPTEIARGREALAEVAADGAKQIAEAESRLRVLTEVIGRRRNQVERLEVGFPKQLPEAEIDQQARGLRPDSWFQEDHLGGWLIRADFERFLEDTARQCEGALTEWRNRTFGGAYLREATRTYVGLAATMRRMHQTAAELEQDLQRIRAEQAERMGRTRRAATETLDPVVTRLESGFQTLPAPFRPWTSPVWESWSEPVSGALATPVYAGTLRALPDPELGGGEVFGAGVGAPLLIPLRGNLELVYGEQVRESALGLMRSLVLRHLAAAPPGELQLTFFDPVGLGQSAGELLDLAEYDPTLIGGKVWSAAADLEARLVEQTAHVELVIQRYLRTTYASVDEFNAEAGEVAEPYRLLVVVDFPTGFTEETLARLKSVMQNGPRCGVNVLLLHNSAAATPYGVVPAILDGESWRIDLARDFVDRHGEYALRSELLPDAGPVPVEVAKRIVDTVGRRVIARTEGAVTFEKVFGLFSDTARRGLRPELGGVPADVAPAEAGTWWRADSTRGLFAPIGQKGARDAAVLGFDSSDSSGALLVGRPGSGKSTLLHSFLAGLTTLYGPDQLELHLVDFKEGVEFASYATEGLPHARTVAIESDREFGLSVLQSMVAELTRRGELLRATGGRHTGLQALREATGEAVPRVLLVFDEFQVLFARNDKVGMAASELLETLIRQGRGFGIHVLLGSQSLSGLDALGTHVPQLLPTRILLAATDLDQRRVLGDHNDAGRYLTTHGQGILNREGGAVEANERFKGALLAEDERLARLRVMRVMADRAGFTRRPMVFEGNSAAPLQAVDPARFRAELAAGGARPVRLRVGLPMTAGAQADVLLRRESGANLLAVVRDGEGDGPVAGPAAGLLAATVASAAQGDARIDVIDFLSVDDGLDVVLEPFLDEGRITLRRRRAFAALVRSALEEMRDRIAVDDGGRQAWLLGLFGVHRARDLDSDVSSLDADVELAEALEEILRDGPEVGIHVWMWADTVTGVSRRLSSRMIRECGWRVAGRMSGDDSHSLLGTEAAGDLRDTQLLLSNDDRGLTMRLTGFGVPPADWLRGVLAARHPTREGFVDA